LSSAPARPSGAPSTGGHFTTAAPSDAASPRHPTRNLKRLMQGLAACPAPHLLDLGRVCDRNIEWLIHRGCTVTVDDVMTTLRPPPAPPPQHRRQAKPAPIVFAPEIVQPAGSFDAILCWDLFDYLEWPGAQLLLQQLVVLLKPRGYLLTFFNSRRDDRPAIRYRIVDDDTLEYERRPTPPPAARIFEHREIQELFGGLTMVNSCFLKHQLMEVLVQKPAARPPR
jgi:hypothetical protein